MEKGTYVSEQLNGRLDQSSQEQYDQDEAAQNHSLRVEIILCNHDEHDDDEQNQ